MVDDKAYRERLLEEQERVVKEIEELEADLSTSPEDSSGESTHDQHMAETAGATLDREIDLTLVDNARATLVRVERALRKLDEGTYGQCDSCGKPIGQGRLDVAPSSTLCVECKRLEERAR